MEVMFDIKKANKAGTDGSEHYIVEFDDMALMQLFGAESQYCLVTATAGEGVGAAPYTTLKCLISQSVAQTHVKPASQVASLASTQ
ncbi:MULTISPECIES: hypothetical protein [Shewanella]|uniref:hypothetical protein n=1 Tax=Shewanella TaxID=22 RepID=UPI000C33CC42|nr:MULTISPECIES: hypothetical protein [Shewanella]EKT4489497.1 hypothetical protein [Shewanella algae]MBO2546210.1 hypothetical protein [Shewanella algae]TVL55351.1 hypothetical protein AYJ00_04740 [Shewanella algae]GHB02506.1 hypothetical protein GCM10007107_14300 [Shewanella indica]